MSYFLIWFDVFCNNLVNKLNGCMFSKWCLKNLHHLPASNQNKKMARFSTNEFQGRIELPLIFLLWLKGQASPHTLVPFVYIFFWEEMMPFEPWLMMCRSLMIGLFKLDQEHVSSDNFSSSVFCGALLCYCKVSENLMLHHFAKRFQN